MKNILLVLILLIGAVGAWAQQSERSDLSYVKVRLYDNTILYGYIIQENQNSIKIKTKYINELTLRREDIRYISYFESDYLVDSYYLSRFRNHYYVTESALMPNKGMVYFDNRLYLFNSLGIALTDFLSMEGGIIPNFDDELYYNLGVKAGYSVFKNWSISVKYIRLTGEISDDLFRHNFTGYLTFGNRSQNVTVGYTTFPNDGFFVYGINNSRGLTFGASTNVGKRSSFMFEHVFLPDKGSLTTFGGSLSYKSVQMKYGLMTPFDYESWTEDFIMIPYISLDWVIGKLY